MNRKIISDIKIKKRETYENKKDKNNNLNFELYFSFFGDIYFLFNCLIKEKNKFFK